MKICYLCDKYLVSKEKFKSENLSLDSHTITHEEHIIQNALGGFIKSTDILCEKCGGELNSLIDTKFINIFKKFINTLDLKIDRKTKNSSFKNATFTLYSHQNHKIDIKVYKESWQPFKNDFFALEDKKLVIFLLNSSKHYNYLLNLWKKDPLYDSNYTIEVISDLRKLEGMIHSNFEITNKAFKQGMAKISTGFACLHNVDKKNLDLVLLKNHFLEKIIFYPYFIDHEANKKFEMINELNFSPFHALYLFNHTNNDLVCYVDLFNTFKGFIVLTNNYNGKPINELYIKETEKNNNLSNSLFINNLSKELLPFYKETIQISYHSILLKIGNQTGKEYYKSSITQSNHNYFYRLQNYISAKNLDNNYFKY